MSVLAWFSEVLERELRPWLTLSADQVSQLYIHYQHLERWNKKMSLTALEPGPELVIRHYCESLFLGDQLGVHNFAKLIDVGSGAGFPGVPVAVLHPQCAVLLVESVQRKSVFLRESTRHLKNVRVAARRAEEIEDRFDWVLSRAVDPAAILKNVPRLGEKVALLIGESGLQKIKGAPGIAWAKPIRLPWGDRRLCIMGRFHV